MGEDHREYLKGLIEFRFYKNYIDQHLAGDFAYDLAQLIRDKNLFLKVRDERIKELEKANRLLRNLYKLPGLEQKQYLDATEES